MKLTGTLTLKVNYEDADYPEIKPGAYTRRYAENVKLIESLLHQIADRAADNGMMSGETELIVDRWDAKVEVA